MDADKDRPEMTPDTEVRRYLSLWAAVDILRTQKLRLTLVEHLREEFDPFEGTVPATVQAHLNTVLSGYYHNRHQHQQLAAHYPNMEVGPPPTPNLWAQMEQRRAAQRRSTHVSCWMAGDESDAMWRLYCDDGLPGLGVSLQTTLGALTHSVAPHNLIVRPITYRHYHELDGLGFRDDLDLCMHKRRGFEHESEVRLAHYNSDHYYALLGNSPPADLDRYIYREWEPVGMLEHITISPRADEVYERTARDVLVWAAGSPSLGEKIELSILHPRRYKPAP